jgi:hypothetical protein
MVMVRNGKQPDRPPKRVHKYTTEGDLFDYILKAGPPRVFPLHVAKRHPLIRWMLIENGVRSDMKVIEEDLETFTS